MKEYKVGDKIKFKEEKQRYTIQACDSRYLICTKPMNALKTYLYTIVDLNEGIRGRCNLIFGLPVHANNKKGASEILGMLYTPRDHIINDDGTKTPMNYEIEISHRHWIKLNIEE